MHIKLIGLIILIKIDSTSHIDSNKDRCPRFPLKQKHIENIHRAAVLLSLSVPRSLDELKKSASTQFLEDYIFRHQGKYYLD